MKMHLIAATALTLSAAAFAQDQGPNNETNQSPTLGADVSIAAPQDTLRAEHQARLQASADWTADQRALWDEHIAFYPADWTPEQRTMYEQMLLLPPSQWSADQQALWELHYSAYPTTWTPEQQALYQQQVAELRTPWMMTHQTASTATATTLAEASPRVVHPSNADPEHDARGIAVLSAAAVVPDGYNGFAGTGMGGPLVDPATGATIQAADASYPACTATVTDNCVQLYERGRDPSAGLGGPIEGEDEIGDNTAQDDALDVDTKPDGTLDVDGDLDGDGDNDIE